MKNKIQTFEEFINESSIPTTYDLRIGVKIRLLPKVFGKQAGDYVIKDIKGANLILRKEKGYDSGYVTSSLELINDIHDGNAEIITESISSMGWTTKNFPIGERVIATDQWSGGSRETIVGTIDRVTSDTVWIKDNKGKIRQAGSLSYYIKIVDNLKTGDRIYSYEHNTNTKIKDIKKTDNTVVLTYDNGKKEEFVFESQVVKYVENTNDIDSFEYLD